MNSTEQRERDRAEAAYVRVRSLIVGGQLSPGTRVAETRVADRLDMSRTPVREALKRLEQDGFLRQSNDGKQSRLEVSPLTMEDAEQIFSLIGALEGVSVRKVASEDRDRRLSLADRLDGINRELEELGRSSDPSRKDFYDLDTRFHRTCIDASRQQRIISLYDAVRPQAERYIRVYVDAHTYEINVSVEEHDAIVAAIRAGLPEIAEQAVENNWRSAARRLYQDIERLGEQGTW